MNAPMPSHSISVLVVDDDLQQSELIRYSLTRHGFVIHTAQSASEALRLLEDTHLEIDLVLTDQQMPGMSGLELAQEILNRDIKVKVALMTGFPLDPEEVSIPGNILLQVAKPYRLRTLTEQLLALLTEP